jgi:hypothetical protein
MAPRRLMWTFFTLFVVSFLATSVAIFAERPKLLAVGLGVGAYALWDDGARHLKRLRRSR